MTVHRVMRIRITRRYPRIFAFRIVQRGEVGPLLFQTPQDEVARNAGFKDYVGYRFKELGRFDYNKEDSFQFHAAVKQHVMPLVNEIYEKKKKKLGLENLRPWDIAQLDADGPTHDVVQQFNQSDLAFLRERARRIQAELWATEGSLHLATRDRRPGTSVTMTRGSDLISVSAKADLAEQCTAVRVSGYDASARSSTVRWVTSLGWWTTCSTSRG